jgi:sodium-dependent dicarboxylate transporter 2/3/5
MNHAPPPLDRSTGSEEGSFDRLRRAAGLVLAPAVLLAVRAVPLADLSERAHRLAAIMAAVVVLWITEALPLPVSALLGACGCVLWGVAPAREVFQPFADPIMFLFIGSFILARAIALHGLDRRVALAALALRWVGGRPGRILVAFGAVTAAMSAWISNTATTAMMFAIGLSLLGLLLDPAQGARVHPRYATGLMLMTSFAASIGGLATPIGTPPNLIGLGHIRERLEVPISFAHWMLLGVPTVGLLYAVLALYLSYFCRAGVRSVAGAQLLIAEQRRSLGPWTVGQLSTLAAFLVTVMLWTAPGLLAIVAGQDSKTYQWWMRHVPEAVAAVIGAALLFVLPAGGGRRAMVWHEAAKIDWGVVLLYGGGMALGQLATQTGLEDAVGRALSRLPLEGSFGVLVGSVTVAVLLSELTSNTASATMVVPMVIAYAHAAGVDPLPPALGATLGASLGFMLPVSTPCNAIVYGSGHIPLGRMVRYGLLLDVAGIAVIVAMVGTLAPLLR